MNKNPGPPQLGRPRGETAVSHTAIMSAVYELLKDMPARDLTMEAVAKRAGVGKPTLYKWWPSKAALIMAMFQERLAGKLESPKSATAEKAIRAKMRRLIIEFNGLFGKVIADLIAEGQSDPTILKELYDRHIGARRASVIEDIERGKRTGELLPEVVSDLVIDAIFGPVYYRHLLRLAPLTQKYGRQLVDQGFQAARNKTNLRKSRATIGKTKSRNHERASRESLPLAIGVPGER